MHRIQLFLIALVCPLAVLLGSSRAVAASNGVRDEAHFFSPQAVSDAEQTIRRIQQRHHKDVLVETVQNVPSDMADELQQQGKDAFFRQWAENRAREQGVNGVYVLICRNPAHLQVVEGNQTEQRLFPISDRNELSRRLLTAFRDHHYDDGLTQGMQFVEREMDAHAGRGGGSTGSATAPPPSAGPTFPRPNLPPGGGTRGWGIGGLACVIIAVVLLIMLIRGIFGRSNRGYYGGPGYPPQGGGYPPAGYPPAGGYGYGGGGGGGFGRGFLGGLLGGALGGYAADKWAQHNQPQGGGYVPPAGGAPDAGSGVDTSYNSTGGDFGDAGGGGGADFGSSGGGDFGGGGGDFGGGDAGGGGGGDFGGGGDAGGSSGGDF